MKRSVRPVRFAVAGTLRTAGIVFGSWLLMGMSPCDIKTLSNGHLTIRIKETGAELTSIVADATGREYLWQGDPAFWKRQAPILFPIVGSLWGDELRHAGKTYTLPLHGFARDKNFQLIVDKPSEVIYRLESDAETLKVYPFAFSLEIGYRLKGNRIEVFWRVENRGKDTMYFQIGAHPGFNYPQRQSGENLAVGNQAEEMQAGEHVHGYLAFGRDTLGYRLIGDRGGVDSKRYTMQLQEGLLPLDRHTFDRDALILEGSRLTTVALLDDRRNPYLSLHFDAPVVGLWSPPRRDAPFVCIEPWFGCPDRVGYSGDYKDKEWMQALGPRAVFNTSYNIEIAPHGGE